jgi:hypothetical protein
MYAWLLSVEIIDYLESLTKVSITNPIFKFFPLIFINGAYESVKTPQSIDLQVSGLVNRSQSKTKAINSVTGGVQGEILWTSSTNLFRMGSEKGWLSSVRTRVSGCHCTPSING